MESKTVDELCTYLEEEMPGIDQTILDNVRMHKINGAVFMALNDEYLREIAPLLGDRVQLKKLITKCLDDADVSEHFSPPASDNSSTSNQSHRTPVNTRGSSLKPNSLKFVNKRVRKSYSPPPLCSPSSSVESVHHSASDDWAKDMIIPTRFSKATMNCIDVGVLSNHARDEIVNSLATCILLHTVSPSADERRVICQRLVKTHPSLQDSIGSGYDSWSRKLTDKFKNLHRSDRAEKAGIPLKKAKVDNSDVSDSSSLEVYERHNKKLLSDYKSGKWSITSMSSLMEESFCERRKLLKSNLPVPEAFTMFPWLKEPPLILKEFSLVTGKDPAHFISQWNDIENKVLRFAEIEEKKKVKSLMKQYMSQKDKDTQDRKTAFVLLILAALFSQRGQSSDSFFIPFEGEVINIEESLAGIPHKHPLILAFGKDLNSLTDCVVLAETGAVVHTPTLAMGLHCAFSFYYIFDIAYPKSNKNFMLFLEQSVYGLKLSMPLSTTVTVVIDSLSKL